MKAQSKSPPTMVDGRPHRLPERLVVGYASWAECDEQIARAVRGGVNVLIWFAVNLALNSTQQPAVLGGPQLACVRAMQASLRVEGLAPVHMLSIGGWNAPHIPDGVVSADAWFDALHQWNVAAGEAGVPLFDGFDWDLEGSDARAPSRAVWVERNTLSVACLHTMGRLSVRARQYGYLVSLAPPQSYLSADTSEFNRSALQPPLGCPPDVHFGYAGRNSYAFLLARYGSTPLADSSAPTFAWVFTQLYESWSGARCMRARGTALSHILASVVDGLATGWEVEFGADPEVECRSTRVRVPRSRLVLGFANGWAAPGEHAALYVSPRELAAAYAALPARARPRGLGFWSIADEGRKVDGNPLFMAPVLASIVATPPTGGLITTTASSSALRSS